MMRRILTVGLGGRRFDPHPPVDPGRGGLAETGAPPTQPQNHKESVS